MVLEAGKLYKKVGDSFVEVNTEDYIAPALTDALELQQASDVPVPTAQAFLTTLALNNLTIQNYSGNVTPTEGDTKQISDSGQIRFYRFMGGVWLEVGGFSGNNIRLRNDTKYNTFIGFGITTAEGVNIGQGNVIFGSDAGHLLQSGGDPTKANANVIIGDGAGYGDVTNGNRGNNNIIIGEGAGASVDTASSNILLGVHAGQNLNTGVGNIFVGYEAGIEASIGFSNLAIGGSAGLSITEGSRNICLGLSSGRSLKRSVGNICIGDGAGRYLGQDNNIKLTNTVVGDRALEFLVNGAVATDVNNSVALGANTRVSGDNQVQLGDSATTTYVFGTVQNRSDIRDKADVKDTELGLDFILKLRPVDYKWDMRDDYIILDDEGNVTKLPKDGSKKRSRYHHGFIAQEVKTIIDETSKDFGGFQDHSVKGGQDVMSIGYDEFIAPMVKAMQEMNEQIKALREEVITLRERVATLEGVSE